MFKPKWTGDICSLIWTDQNHYLIVPKAKFFDFAHDTGDHILSTDRIYHYEFVPNMMDYSPDHTNSKFCIVLRYDTGEIVSFPLFSEEALEFFKSDDFENRSITRHIAYKTDKEISKITVKFAPIGDKWENVFIAYHECNDFRFPIGFCRNDDSIFSLKSFFLNYGVHLIGDDIPDWTISISDAFEIVKIMYPNYL